MKTPSAAPENLSGSPQLWLSKSAFLRLASGFAIVSALLLAFAVVHIMRTGSQVHTTGWAAGRVQGAWTVKTVDKGGPADGLLHTGDKLISVDGDPAVQKIGPQWILRDAPSRTSYELSVERDGKSVTQTIPWPVRSEDGLVKWRWIYLAIFTVYAVVGLLIAYGKPESLAARLAVQSSILGGAFFFAAALNAPGGMLGGPLLVLALLSFFVRPLHIVAGYRFNAAFPLEIPSTGWWRRFELTVYALALLVWVPSFYGALVRSLGPERAAHIVAAQYPFSLLHDAFVDSAGILLAAILSVANALVCVRNYRAVADLDLKRRLRWVSIGVGAGMIPIFLMAPVLLIGYALGQRVALVTVVRVINSITIIIPLCVAYAILRHRVLGIRVILRAGIRYLFARNVLRVALVLPVAFVVYNVVTHPSTTMADLVRGPAGRFNVLWILLAGAGLLYRRQLLLWLDRRFFREAYQQDQIFLSLAEGIGRAADVVEISRLLSTQVEAALHPQSVFAVSCEGSDEFSALYSSSGKGGERSLQNFHLSPSDFNNLNSSAALDDVGSVGDAARASLRALGISLLVPIRGPNEGLVGLLLLGEKRSEEPYTRHDRRLLDTTATQTGVVWENVRLRARLKREQGVRRDVVAQLAGSSANMLMECETCGLCYDSTDTVCSVDGRELSPSMPVSRTLDGKYLLERLIGRGGMGAVYEATDVRLARSVAVKITPGTMFADSLTLERFAREARASAKLDHPHVVRAFDFGELPSCAYLVLEHLRGVTLRRELQVRGRLPISEVRTILDEITSGIAAAHARHIVHRDIKPENIFLAQVDGVARPVTKILDFGLAVVRDLGFEDRNRLTQTGAAVGTLAYMSIEQFLGERVDERADIYSLGVVTLEMLTGELTTKGPTFGRIGAIMNERLSDSSGIPGHASIAHVLRRALAEQREDRYATIGEFRTGILSALDDSPLASAIGA